MRRIYLTLAAALALTLPASATLLQQEPKSAAESYKLPITPPLDQGESGLCWIYATLSMLETNYLASHPGSTLRLSRGGVQRASILDRFQRAVTGNSTHLEDGGLAVDALRLIAQQGVVAEADAPDVVEESEPVFAAVSQHLAAVEGADDKLKALDGALKPYFGPAPSRTSLDGRTLTPQDLAKAVLGGKVWTEYDLAPPGAPKAGPSSDPDARPETRVRYIDLSAAIGLIHASLKRGEAVVWGSNDNHALLIYGADYDAQGKALAYWVKDSFAPYARRVDADTVHAALTDVTVTTPPSETTAAGG